MLRFFEKYYLLFYLIVPVFALISEVGGKGWLAGSISGALAIMLVNIAVMFKDNVSFRRRQLHPGELVSNNRYGYGLPGSNADIAISAVAVVAFLLNGSIVFALVLGIVFTLLKLFLPDDSLLYRIPADSIDVLADYLRDGLRVDSLPVNQFHPDLAGWNRTFNVAFAGLLEAKKDELVRIALISRRNPGAYLKEVR